MRPGEVYAGVLIVEVANLRIWMEVAGELAAFTGDDPGAVARRRGVESVKSRRGDCGGEVVRELA